MYARNTPRSASRSGAIKADRASERFIDSVTRFRCLARLTRDCVFCSLNFVTNFIAVI